jgi:hypothetical protein
LFLQIVNEVLRTFLRQLFAFQRPAMPKVTGLEDSDGTWKASKSLDKGQVKTFDLTTTNSGG